MLHTPFSSKLSVHAYVLVCLRTWAQMVSRFEALLQCYQEHCVSRSATMLHLHGSDKLSVQEVSKGYSTCIRLE